jgi:hypothetical protein
LSITTLSARQIVTGKLGSAVLQMVVYYSALSPCIAFTYLLRGVDIITILLILFYTFLASLLLSAFGLMVATITHLRHVQILLSVALLIGLLFVTIMWCAWTAAAVYELGSMPYDEADFWIVQFAIVSGHLTYLVLFIYAAAAQISFASENRSTKLRIIMLFQQVLYFGWMAYAWLREGDEEILLVLMAFSAIHWMVMGALMTGELAALSPRVKRSLPQSFLGRALLTWFNPGSGTGYVFAVSSLASTALCTSLLMLSGHIVGFRGADEEVYMFSLLATAYVAAYLGVGRLLVLALRRVLYFGLLLPFLIHIILALLGAAIPTFLQAWWLGFANFDDYTALQAPNWFWTLIEAGDGDILADPAAPILVMLAAGGIFLINLIFAAREVEQTRQETPERVVQDEQEMHPEKVKTVKEPGSPWDE